jgi:hypothetical protein
MNSQVKILIITFYGDRTIKLDHFIAKIYFLQPEIKGALGFLHFEKSNSGKRH